MPLTPIPALDRTASTFKADVDTFFGSRIPTFVTEVNALETDLLDASSDAVAAAAAAAASASNADASAVIANAAVASASSVLGLTLSAVTGTSVTAAAGYIYVLQNAAATTVTLPASPANGEIVGILIANGRIDNVINRNGKQVMGLSENVTLDVAIASVTLRYVDSTSQWRFI